MGRHRFRGEGSRSGSVALGVASGRISPHRNLSRRSSSHSHPEQHQPPSKADVLMEAGRLAAEYLVSKGLLPHDSLPGSSLAGEWHGSARRELKTRSREGSMPPPERRTSALARLGSTAPDAGHGRRRSNDEHDRWGSRKRSRNSRTMEHYDRRHGSEWGDRGRPRGRNGAWTERARGYSDNADPEVDFAPGFHPRGWRGAFGDAADELPSRSEATGESGHREFTDDSRFLNSEARGEVKSHASGDPEKKAPLKERLAVQHYGVEDGPASEHDRDLLKPSSIAKVPTRRRASVAHRSMGGDQGRRTEVSGASEAAPTEATKVAECSSSDSHANQTNNLKCQAPDDSSILSLQPMEESVNPRQEPSQSPQGMEISLAMVDAREEDSFAQHVDKREGIKSERESSQPHNLKTPQSCSFEAVDQEQASEEKQLKPAMFKICDLNLMGSPEITEIPDDPVSDHQPTSLISETKKKLSVDYGLSTGNNTDNSDDCRLLSGDDKVVPVINVEDDSPVEDNVCGSSKPKGETIHSSLENVLSHTPHTDELPGIQDGYSLGISELLGGNISRCPSVQADLNNLQTGMSLHSTEGFPGDDDPIFVSLGELAIDMALWRSGTSQDYEKLF